MPSPFPGMDPYLEGPLWPDFAFSFPVAIRDPLASRLRGRSVARLNLGGVDVRDREGGRLLVRIEMIRPFQKAAGLDTYRRERGCHLAAGASLLEIDLLRDGTRTPHAERLPKCDYLIALTRPNSSELWTWPLTLRDPLPVVPVPAANGDDLPLDLGAAFRKLYDDAGYDLSIDYSQPPPPPELSPDDAAWVRELTARR